MNVSSVLSFLIIMILPLLAQADPALVDAVEPESYGWWSLLPAALAITMALVTRQVLISLFLGVWAGSWVLAGGDFGAVAQGFLNVIDTWVLQAIVPEDAASDHISIILFTLTTGGMIGIISHNGGIEGIITWVLGKVKNARQGQFASMLAGLAVFFDDYASMLIVGNTMRPLTDQRRISREKLAYIVDTTAAPIASIAVVTTWIGFQVSLLDGAMNQLPTLNIPAYELMLASVPYSFYSVLSLIFIFMVIATNRDMGPMLKAERKARLAPQPEVVIQPREVLNQPTSKAVNALLPLLVLVLTVVVGLVATGWPDADVEVSAREVLGNADPFKAMLWASLASLVTAILVTMFNTKQSVEQIMEAMQSGLIPMLTAVMILTFAWAIAAVNDALGTADFLVAQLEGNLAPQLLPATIFILASIIAFATGTSWGVMAILVPLAVPLAWGALEAAGMGTAEHYGILYAVVASTLTGAVLGDHCSPISDTTILSSVASGCDHIEHVRTQMPYAMLIGIVSLLVGLIPAGYGAPWWVGMMGSLVILFIVLRVFGKKVD